MSKIPSGDPRAAQGRKRQAELVAEMTRAIEINSKIMLEGLGRPYSSRNGTADISILHPYAEHQPCPTGGTKTGAFAKKNEVRF